MRSTQSPSLRSRYDYYYSTLSPGSSAANFYDNQNLSLFGDPVPPATDFLETLDNHLYGSFRRNNSAGDLLASNGIMLSDRPPIPTYNRDYIRIMSSAGTAISSSTTGSSAAAAARRRDSFMQPQHSTSAGTDQRSSLNFMSPPPPPPNNEYTMRKTSSTFSSGDDIRGNFDNFRYVRSIPTHILVLSRSMFIFLKIFPFQI